MTVQRGRLAVVLAVSGVVLFSPHSGLSQESRRNAARESRPAAAPVSRPSNLPKDPVLRQAYEELVTSMRALTAPTDEDVASFEARVVALAEVLVAKGESEVAFSLYDDWCEGVCVRRGRHRDALSAYARAEEIFRRNADEGNLARTALHRGVVFASLSQYDEALAEYAKAAGVFVKLGDEGRLAGIAHNRGFVFASRSQYAEALAEFAKAASIYEKLGDEGNLAQITLNRGFIFQSRSRYQEALDEFAKAARVFERLGDEASLAQIALNRGVVFQSLSQHDEALAEFAKAAKVFEKLGDERSLATIAQDRGNVFQSLSQYKEALAEYAKAARIYEKLEDEGRLAQIAHCRGIVFASLSQYEDALAEFAKAARGFEKIGDERSRAGIALNSAIVYQSLSRPDEALAEYARAARVFEKLEDEGSLAQIALNRGNLFRSLSRYEDALAEFAKAATVFEKFGDEGRLAQIALNRGNVFSSLSRYEEALAEYAKAARVAEKLGNEGRLANIALNRGVVFQSLSRYEEALAEFAKAAGVYERLQDDGRLATIALNRGNVFSSLSRHEDALAELAKAAKVYERLGDEGRLAHIAANRGAVFHSLSRDGDALAEFAKAAKVYEKLGDEGHLATIAHSRGVVFRSLSRYEDALAEFAKAARVYEKLGDEGRLAEVALCRGSVFQSLSHHEEALASFSEAATRLESILQSQVQKLGEASSTSYREGFHEVVRGALRSAVAIPNLTEAQRAAAYKIFGVFMGLGTAEMIAERGRMAMPALPDKEARRYDAMAVELRQAVANRDRILEAQRKAGVSAEARKKLDDELAAVVDGIRRLELESSVLIEQARQGQQVYVGIRYPKAATTAEVQTELEPDAALLEYAVDGGEVFAFVTTRTGQRLVPLGEAKEVLEDIDCVRSALVPKAAPAPDPARLRRLGARLLDPLLATLPKEPKVRTLLIAGHGDLARIPFEILLVEDLKEGADPRERPYLLTRHDVAYVHSGTVMRAMRLDAKTQAGAGRKEPELVGFGFPFDAKAEKDDDDLPEKGLMVAERAERAPLPGSAAEVLEIARLFAKGERETKALDQAIKDFADDPMTRGVSDLTGERFSLHLRLGATEEALKKDPAVRTARILHVACHAEADLISPALSRLVLAQSGRLEKESGEDGFVYLRELRELGMSAELLVLSACETNAGKLHPLEGITGLSRAGLAAGAESVISTFWRVDDAAARTLMVDFYRRWMEGRTTRIAALCDAKRSAIKGGIPMKTWAAYALWDAKTR